MNKTILFALVMFCTLSWAFGAGLSIGAGVNAGVNVGSQTGVGVEAAVQAEIHAGVNSSVGVGIQVHAGLGIPMQPTCFWGLDLIRDNSQLGLGTPSVSLVSDFNADLPEIVTRASSNLVASLFPTSTNISLSINVPHYCNNNNSVSARVSFGTVGGILSVLDHVFDDIEFVATTLGSIWCSVGATCSLEITGVSLNNQTLNSSLVVDASRGIFGNLVQHLLFQSAGLSSCSGFDLQANIRLSCTNSGNSFGLLGMAGGLFASNSRTQCRFSFGQLCL